MQNFDTSLLESKLKRLKISFSKENGKLIISSAKRDYTTLLGLIFFPLFIAICATLFLIFSDIDFNVLHGRKVILLIVFLFVIGIGSIFRFVTKVRVNSNTKILGYKEIILKTKEISKRFDASTTKDFVYSVEEVTEDDYQGTLFLIDSTNKEHLLLGFSGETEQYVVDDLEWFASYFLAHLGIAATDV